MGRAGYDTTFVCNDKNSAAAAAIAMADEKRTQDAVRTTQIPLNKQKRNTANSLCTRRPPPKKLLLPLLKPN
jgi:hypothetical protein